MRVRMKTLAAGPDGVYQPGQVVNLDPGTAEAFVDGGYAEQVVPSQVETATAGPKGKATAPAQKKSRSKPRPAKSEEPKEK